MRFRLPPAVIFSLIFLVACGGGGTESSVVNVADQQLISGSVYDQQNGSSLAGVTMSTLPATEEVTTGPDGVYSIRTLNNPEPEYEVFARKLGYKSDQVRVSVAANSASTADFQLAPNVNGLATSVGSLHIPRGESRSTFTLTSTIPDTGFTIQSTAPWLTATPSQGTIRERENKIIVLGVDRASLSGDRVASQLVINTTNGSTGVIMDITADINAAPPSSDTTIGGSTDDATSNNDINQLTGDIIEPAVGLPGSNVDCKYVLPCTWLSENAAFEFTILYSDGISTPPYGLTLGPGETYTIGYQVRSLSSDADLIITGDSNAIDSDNNLYLSSKIFTPDISGLYQSEVSVFQNAFLRIRNHFDKTVRGQGHMSQVSLSIVVNDVPLEAKFENLPYGRENSADIDCTNNLPCEWQSADGLHRVLVDEVKPDVLTKELLVEFTFTTQSDGLEIFLGNLSTASGNDSMQFSSWPVQRELGDISKLNGDVTVTSTSNVPINGSLLFREEPTNPTLTGLTRFQLHIYQNRGWSPLWSPIFFNLPVN